MDKVEELVKNRLAWDEEINEAPDYAEQVHKLYKETETALAETLKQLFIKLDYKKLIDDWKPESKRRMELLMHSELLRKDVVSGKNESLRALCSCAISNVDTDAFFDNLEVIVLCGV